MADKQASLVARLMLWSGYAAFFMLCFVLFAYWTFPYNRVRDVVVKRVEASAPGSKVKIGDLGPHWLTGVTLSEVRLETPAEKKGDTSNVVELDELTISVSPLALALGTTHVNFAAEVGEGALDGSYSTEEDGPTTLVAELDAVELAALGLAGYLKVPMTGAASGELDVTLSKEPADTNGMVDLQVADFTLGDGKTKVPIPGGWGGVTVPTMNLGTLVIKIAVKEGVATVEKLEAKGKDVSMSGSGSVLLVQPFSRSRADLTLGIKVEEAFEKREPKIKTLMSMPQVKQAIGGDGAIRFGLAGAVNALKAKPGAGRAKRPRSTKTTK